jgi:hypothetical protein
MVRNILSVIVAFVVGGIFVFLFEALGHRIYPVPEGIDSTNMQAIAEYVKTAPVGAILAVLVAQSAGSLVGGFITGLISIAKRATAIVYGILALIMAGINLVMIPHPWWFMVFSIVLPIPLSLLGSQIASGLTARKE